MGKPGTNKGKPACKRYTAEKRWEKNKVRRMARHDNRMTKKALKKLLRQPASATSRRK